MVVPSCAVTTMLIAFGPTASVMAGDADPEATVTVFTFIVALALVAVGVTVNDAVALLTVDV
jgi:hypothetical protein